MMNGYMSGSPEVNFVNDIMIGFWINRWSNGNIGCIGILIEGMRYGWCESYSIIDGSINTNNSGFYIKGYMI